MAQRAPPDVRLFFLVLNFSGARISEVLALTPEALDIESGAVSIHTLKRRRPGIVRQVPLPRDVLSELNRVLGLRRQQRDPDLSSKRLWRWSRTTAWRRVKEIMAAARIAGPHGHPSARQHRARENDGFRFNGIPQTQFARNQRSEPRKLAIPTTCPQPINQAAQWLGNSSRTTSSPD
jgi:integrase